MQVLIDLNVLLDVIQKRDPHYAASGKILGLVAKRKLSGQIPAHALTTIHYIVAKYVGHAKAGQTIDWLLSTLKVIPAGQKAFIRARSLNMPDFEDAVVASLAEAGHSQYIVSRNVSDFKNSRIPAITPEELLVLMTERA
ncbi:MAG: PIN domain-containing protein [bacterium]